jgi:cell envelope-related function transcriptional attenuator common domain
MDSSNKYVINEPSPRGGNKVFRVLLAIFCLLVASLLGIVGYYVIKGSQMLDEGDVHFSGEVGQESENVEGLPDADDQAGGVTGIDKGEDEIDIIMIGVDNRKDEFTGRSDVMMFLRVNTTDKTIKMVSFMRDTLVSIDDHGKNKLNTAYGFGGVDLMYDTFNSNFGLVPDYFIVVNFYGMEDIINTMGGVDIELDKDELEWLNININEINGETSGENVANIKKSGMQHLNGRQAVAYMRIRHPGWDAGRIARQQKVMFKLFEKAKNLGVGQIPSLIETMSEYVRTDLSIASMIELATSIQGMQTSSIATFRYPDAYKDRKYNGMSIVQPEDFDVEYRKLYDFLNG